MLGQSQHPFLPPQLMNPMLGGMSFPWNGGGKLPEKPNPLTQPQMPHSTSADAAGIQQAMAKRGAQDSSTERLSSAGSKSGVSYKIDDEGSLTGSAAFDTLDGYMKSAGLNSFQTQFFTALIKKGMDEQQIRGAVKQANARFGDTIGDELTEGLEKIAVGGALRALGRGAMNLGSRYFGSGARQAAGQATKKAPAAAKQSIQSTMAKVKNPGFVEGLAGKAKTPNVKSTQYGTGFGSGVFNNATDAARTAQRGAYRLGRNVRAVPGRAAAQLGQAGQSVKNLVKAPSRHTKAQLGNMGMGATTGAFNPYTGIGSGNVMTEDGFDLGNLAASMGTGALAGRFGGRAVRQAMQRGLAGETVGAVGGGLGGLAGYDTNALQGARWGFGAGAASRAAPGLRSTRVQKMFNAADPSQYLAQGARGVGNWAMKHPRDAMVGAGALAAGGSAIDLASNLKRSLPDIARRKADEFGNLGLDQLQSYKEELAPQAQRTMADVSQAAKGVTNITGGGEGGWMGSLGNLFGGGEGGGIGGMLGGVGDYLKQNPWLTQLLLPALIGGGGGYALGGKGGAALGGIGLPLIMALLSGQGGQQAGAGNDSTQAARTQALEDAAIADQIRSGNVVQSGTQQPNQNEIQRQRQQQEAYNQ